MGEDNLIWLINNLKKVSSEFKTLYKVDFKVHDLILLERGEPKQWYQMTKTKKIKQRDEEFNKLKVIKEYFNNPNITLEQAIEAEAKEPDYTQKFNKKNDPQYDNDILFYYFSQYTADDKSFQVIRPVQRKVAQELLQKPTEYVEFLSTWQKIIPFNQLNVGKKGPQLYQVQYSAPFKGINFNLNVNRKSIENQCLQVEEFIKTEQPKAAYKFQEKIYKSLSSIVNEICSDFIKAIVRSLENSYKHKIANLTIEFFLTEDNKIFLSGCQNIKAYDNQGENIEAQSLKPFEVKPKIQQRCNGVYCDLEGKNIFYDQSDEAFSLFIPATNKQNNKVQHVTKKAILLDLIERCKTIQAIKQATEGQNQMLTEQLIYKCRRYYSISHLTQSNFFKHLKVENLFEKNRVCNTCFNIYNQVDFQRQKILEDNPKRIFSKEEILKIIESLKTENGILQGDLYDANLERKKFDDQFIYKIKEFDSEQEKFDQEYQLIEEVDNTYYQKKFINSQSQNQQTLLRSNFLKKSQNSHSYNNLGLTSAKNRYSRTQDQFQLPKIYCKTLKSKDNMIDKRQLYVGKVDSESLGLKHYLGHTKNLPKADSGLAISKSSLALNKLQDKIGEVSKIRKKIEELKVSKVREEIVMMLCPHIGKGQRDLTNLKKFLDDLKAREELEKLQEQDQLQESEDQQSQLQNQQINQGENQIKDNSQFFNKNSSNSQYNKKEIDDQILSQDEQNTQNISRLNTLQQIQQSQKSGSKKDQNEKKVRVQVATDKNEFLSENQKKLKQDKEQKAKLMQDQKKYFLEEHQDLAKSVFGIKQRIRQQRKTFKILQKQQEQLNQQQNLNSQHEGQNNYINRINNNNSIYNSSLYRDSGFTSYNSIQN